MLHQSLAAVGFKQFRMQAMEEITGVASWEIDLFGRIRSLEKESLQQFFATEQARRGAQVLLVAEVAKACLTLAADRENLRLAQTTLQAQQNSFSLIQRRYERGCRRNWISTSPNRRWIPPAS